MMSTAENPIDATLIGTAPAAGSVTQLVDGQLSVRTDAGLELHDAQTFLSGTLAATRSLTLPPFSAAAPLPGGAAVVAEGSRIRALGPDGATRWQLSHARWHGGHRDPRPPGRPAVSPDGALVSVLVPTPAVDERAAILICENPPRHRYARDTLLLLDAATGEIRARRPIGAISSDVTQRWHPDGSLLALSCWTAWYSWSTWWIEPRRDGLHIRGGTTMREVIDFLPDQGRVLTLRRAEGIAHNDDRDELASHDVAADDPACLFDLGQLAADRDNDEVAGAFLIDAGHVLVTGRIYLPGRPVSMRHWLCDTATLRPLGRLRYPVAVGGDVTPLGDGSWLTRDRERLHHWALP
ncbi:hypothetical protein FBY35_4944 [Streptomyces sp. SLBN-118]|uniref:hypothetical protein n=1 Tax=Streptomyces sp. SLBN-118 TaxID=2768454 RepID=UPI001154E979|nr:hypothetical protein [Streptomyces sp. SLBN-118]TQK43476.1 hypothetical protein FBY35_4944 [Streptomyces sp. SLBN-118]